MISSAQKRKKILSASIMCADIMNFGNITIEVDGNCSFENVPKMYKACAEIFVVGTSSVFKKGLTVEKGTQMLLDTLKD